MKNRMINSFKLSSGFRRSFLREVLLPLIAVLAITFTGAIITVLWATNLSNHNAQTQQQQTIQTSFSQALNEHLRQNRSLTRWGPLAAQLNTLPINEQWLTTNIGQWLYEMFSHQLVMILDHQNRPIYGWIEGKRVDQQQLYDRYAPMLQPPLTMLTAIDNADGIRHDIADFVQLDGHPAALALGDISGRTNSPGPYRLLSIKRLDDGFLTALATRSQLKKLHFTDDPREQRGKANFLLVNQTDQPIGNIAWLPSRPGAQMLKTIGPMVLLTVLIITLLCILMMRRLWFSSLKLSQSMLKLGASEAQAQHLAYHDVLTGLPNRALIEERLTHALALSSRSDRLIALLLLDLDRFKMVNDTYGHHAGDALIIEVSQRLSGLLRSSDTVGRIGGDEFVVVMSDVESIDQVNAVCQRIIEALSQPFVLLNNETWIGVSIGLVLSPRDGTDRSELMRKADIALYEAKNNGRSQFCQFEEVMDESVRTRQMLAAELRLAMQNRTGLAVWYQPLMDIHGTRVLGVEALLRWQHPEHGMISPAEFINIAEETGLIIALGEWVLREACGMARQWPLLTVAVNVSPVQFRSAGFVKRVIDIVSEEACNPHQIELEITEGVLIQDEREACNIIVSLREAGFPIALDDFGTGYSSLNYLSQFPVDKIKIDRSFIQALGVVENSTAIIESVVRLGHAMGLTVTAEGVETNGQMSALADAGCNQLQGYLFSQALPAEELESMLSASRALP